MPLPRASVVIACLTHHYTEALKGKVNNTGMSYLNNYS